jgi:hypothetical protein
MYTLDAVGVFQIEHPPETYIYDIQPVADGIVAISSDDCLRLIDPLVLHAFPLQLIQNVHNEITCLKTLDPGNSIVCTAGRDGRVNIFDFRAKTKVAELRTGRNFSIFYLDVLLRSGHKFQKSRMQSTADYF